VHKNAANRELEKILKSIEGTIWLLTKCNHSESQSSYPHHVRDRISEAIVEDFRQLAIDVQLVQDAIDKGLENEQEENPIPF
jgi:hypothetical protein